MRSALKGSEDHMKAKVLGLAMALIALVATGANAATKLAQSGCCPLCK